MTENKGSPLRRGDRGGNHRVGAYRRAAAASRHRSSSAAGSFGRACWPTRKSSSMRPMRCATGNMRRRSPRNRAALETPFASSWKGAAKPRSPSSNSYDYACPYCKASNPHVDQLISENPGLRVVYRELPDPRARQRRGGAPLAGSIEGGALPRVPRRALCGRPAGARNQRSVAARVANIAPTPIGRPGDRGRAQEEHPACRPARRDGHTTVRRRRPGPQRRGRLRRAQESDASGARRRAERAGWAAPQHQWPPSVPFWGKTCALR